MYIDDDELKRQLDEINDYINLKQAEQREYDRENEAKDRLDSFDKNIFKKASIVAGAAAAGFDPDDPTSLGRSARNGAHAIGILFTILIMIGGLFAFTLLVPSHGKISPTFTYAFYILEALGLFVVIRLIRSMLGKPLLIKMLFSRSDMREARYYHGNNTSATGIALLVLCALALIIILAIAVLILI